MMPQTSRAQHSIHAVTGQGEHHTPRPRYDRPRTHLFIEWIRVIVELPLRQSDERMAGLLPGSHSLRVAIKTAPMVETSAAVTFPASSRLNWTVAPVMPLTANSVP